MRVRELAGDLKVDQNLLLQFLRETGVRVGHPDAPIRDADVAKVRTRLEKQKRLGQVSAAEAMQAVVKDSKPVSRRRKAVRRRVRRVKKEEAPAEAATEVKEEAKELSVGEAEQPRDEAQADVPTTPTAEADKEVAEVVVAEKAPPAEEGTTEVGEEATPDSTKADQPPPKAEVATEVAEGKLPKVKAEAKAKAKKAPVKAEQPQEATAPPTKPKPAPKPVTDLKPRATAKPISARQDTELPPPRSRATPSPAASAGPGGRVRIKAEGYTADGRRKRKAKKGKRRRGGDRNEAQAQVQKVMSQVGKTGKKRRKGKAAAVAEAAAAEDAQQASGVDVQPGDGKVVEVTEFLTVAELAELIDSNASDLIGSAFRDMGILVTINQRLDFDHIEMLLEGFGYKAQKATDYVSQAEEIQEEEDDPAELRPRPPVVTVMGHVDHGKTKLLDWIRSTNVVAGEEGGITQHIGAYHVVLEDGRSISFLDTPGHAAFTAMRARGADVTDLVVLVVAADDAVMPQTVEAISHAKSAGVPIVVAINKIDLPTANPLKVKQDLLQHDITAEEFGGEVQIAEVSAVTGDGMEDLLDKILVQAELLELKANPNRAALGTVVEAELDKGKGPIATVLVQNGTLKVGDSAVAGLEDGRIRALMDERGKPVKKARPGIPVQIQGLSGVPQAGDILRVMPPDQAAEIGNRRKRLEREKKLRIRDSGHKLGDFGSLEAAGEERKLNLIIKGDVDGSVQALADSLGQLSTSEVKVAIVHRNVGAINESDVMLAVATRSVIIGFGVRPDAGSRQAAAREGVDIRVYNIIYEAVDEVRAALEGMLTPEKKETVLGSAEVRKIFKIRGTGTIGGSSVIEGSMERKAKARVIRDGSEVYNGEMASLKRFKDDVTSVREGFECGIGIANFNDLKVGDVIESYQVEEIARTLAESRAG